MKITCQKTDLVKGVNIVKNAIPVRTTVEIQKCILIDASADKITFTANDLEIGIETVVTGDILERGIIALDAAEFSKYVGLLPDNEITIETDSRNEAKIMFNPANPGDCFTLLGKSGESFTKIPEIKKNEPIVISQFTFKNIIKQTIFSVADNENNKLMTGELLDIKDNKLKVVALDGHRVSIRNVDLKDQTSNANVIIPKKTLTKITNIINGTAEDNLFIYPNENDIVFEFDNTIVNSRIIAGEFFQVERMLSDNYETKVKINRKDMLEVIKRASAIVHEGDKKPIIVNIENDVMTISISSNISSFTNSIEIVKEGKDIMIGFNPKFIREVIENIDDEEISLYLLNAKSPCFIRDDSGSYVYIILPVNFNNPGAN